MKSFLGVMTSVALSIVIVYWFVVGALHLTGGTPTLWTIRCGHTSTGIATVVANDVELLSKLESTVMVARYGTVYIRYQPGDGEICQMSQEIPDPTNPVPNLNPPLNPDEPQL